MVLLLLHVVLLLLLLLVVALLVLEQLLEGVGRWVHVGRSEIRAHPWRRTACSCCSSCGHWSCERHHGPWRDSARARVHVR